MKISEKLDTAMFASVGINGVVYCKLSCCGMICTNCEHIRQSVGAAGR